MATAAFPCRECFSNTKIIDSRPSTTSVRRRRECLKCGARFTTYEGYKPIASVESIKHLLEDITDKVDTIQNLIT